MRPYAAPEDHRAVFEMATESCATRTAEACRLVRFRPNCIHLCGACALWKVAGSQESPKKLFFVKANQIRVFAGSAAVQRASAISKLYAVRADLSGRSWSKF